MLKFILLKFWQICLISILGQIIFVIINMFLMNELLYQKSIKDGMPIVGVIIFGVFFVFIILIIISIQLYVHYRDK